GLRQGSDFGDRLLGGLGQPDDLAELLLQWGYVGHSLLLSHAREGVTLPGGDVCGGTWRYPMRPPASHGSGRGRRIPGRGGSFGQKPTRRLIGRGSLREGQRRKGAA